MLSDCIPYIFGLCLYDCNTKNEIFMNISTDAFFQTNNYSSAYHGDLDKCNITFTYAGPGDDVLIMVFKTELFFDDKNNTFKNVTSYDPYFSTTYSFKDHYTKKDVIPYSAYAQFGYISFEPKQIPRCMVETTKPVFLLSELEMYFIESDFLYMLIPSESCHWKFATTEEYGFKVVIQFFEPKLISALEIKNSTDTFVNYRSAKIGHAYYNSDTYLQIDVFKSTNISIRAFVAYVTVVKKTKPLTNICPHYTDAQGDVFWDISTKPHIFNIYCSYDLIITNTSIEYDVTVEKFQIERYVDFLRYTYDEVNGQNTTVYINGPSLMPLQDEKRDEIQLFTLYGYPNGSERHYFWEFGLDGSIPTFGTSVSFSKISCHCIGNSIPCTADEDSKPTGIMNRNDSRYCGNLNCSFTIEPCLAKIHAQLSGFTMLQLKINREFYNQTIQVDANMDIFTLYSDSTVVLHLELDTFNKHENDYVLFLNNSKVNTFEVVTFSSRLSKILSLETNRVTNPPTLHTFTLTSDKTFVVIDTGVYTTNIIKIQNFENSEKFVIYSNTKYGIQLFENENLLVSYADRRCFGDLQPYICNISNKEFAMFIPAMYLPYPFLLIQSANYYQKGCVFNQNIFIAKEVSQLPIAIIANSKDDCITTLLIDYDIYAPNYYYISSYWTSSETENVQIFAGTDSLYLEFNFSTSNKYTRIDLFSLLYTIKVPKSSAIVLQLNQFIANVYDYFEDTHISAIPTITVEQDNYSSIISTAFYGTSKGKWGFKELYYCFPFRKLKFTTLYYGMGVSEGLYLSFKSQTTQIKQNGDIFIFDNRISKNQTSNVECIQWNYFPENIISPAKNGIIFKVETI